MKRRFRDDARRMLTLLVGFALGIHAGVLLHELGHALGALLAGGQVTAVVMQAPLPVGFVRSSAAGSAPVVWGGVGFGTLFCLLPLLLSRKARPGTALWLAVLMSASLGLAHNGLYLVVGALAPFADAAEMVRLGAPRLLLGILGLPVLGLAVRGLATVLAEIGLSPREPFWRWLAVVEPPLLAVPLVMMAGLPPTADGALRTAMTLLVSGYAICFAAAAWQARRALAKRAASDDQLTAPPAWSVPLKLAVAAVLLIAAEVVFFHPR
jgi:hypothetical protein